MLEYDPQMQRSNLVLVLYSSGRSGWNGVAFVETKEALELGGDDVHN